MFSNKIKNNNKKVGISIKPFTPVNVLSKYLEHIDLILIMTVEPGFGGQKLMNDQIEKIKKTKELILILSKTDPEKIDAVVHANNVNAAQNIPVA